MSHLRVSEQPINSAYLVSRADFVGCHQLQFIDKYQMVERLKPGGTFLLNTPYGADEVWSRLPQEVQALLHQRQARFYIINAAKLARECRLGARINTVMQMAFFHLTQILPSDVALQQLQDAIARSYSSKGQEIVERNWQALGATRAALTEIPLQPVDASSPMRPPVVSDAAPDFVKTVTAAMLAGLGDALPVSAFPPDGTWPVGTTQWEKRNIAEDPGLAARPVHPVQPLRRRLPALRHSRQGGSAGGDGTRPRLPAITGCQSARYARPEIRAAGSAGRLHRL